MARRKEKTYQPGPAVQAAWPPGVSGNVLNGQGETAFRKASPFFWHPPTQHPFGTLQQLASDGCRCTQEAVDEFAAARNYPALVPVNPERAERTAAEWTALAREFALANESDLFGATTVKEHYIVEGYDIDVPNVVMLGFAHDYDNLKQVPSSPANGKGIAEVGRQYARCTRASYKLANWIRSQGFNAYPYPGPRADALLLIPPAIDAGLGELGKHGSLINRTYGANLRLAGVTTDMPLVFNDQDVFGSDDFCLNCRICEDACPPDAITDTKQWVRGAERWYVDFDKCIPFFAENAGCAICLAVCPWSRPGIADNLVVKMARRRATQAGGHGQS
ncbi:4Fe-4S dicluster domain-containing protein [Niveispirillum sp.]|uniref:4Fe-4S dicluster domain-containing protein n=1 Tax=Niveispirillum sp. TaxID=1917217 RepID=UPI001B440F80|nr:4Fe-4S dicluster domain-containing protein [Niveispirillum sp.]MBP7339472.1 4Fe-4S dicluster domain-containing protein [Niveispirillum sp.]